MSQSTLRLTPQQQAIVDHNSGPALVYAVAGAGKTTAMVHRIARLVRENVFPPWQILATSFNRDANRQIEDGLRRWSSCADVRVKTLHAIGYTIIRLAGERGYLPPTGLATTKRNPAAEERSLLFAALEKARTEGVDYAAMLDRLDHDDFLSFVRWSKGNLLFPDPRSLRLPRRFRKVTSKLIAPEGRIFYLDLYAHFEQLRAQRGSLTFDDMLATGWLMLARHEDLLAEMRKRHRCLLVDEFQDINRAQAEILDLIASPINNFMAIGDDDQTIYEWRGASADHMRNFRRRYRGATTYFMTDNFRSGASQLVLANQVIQQDQQRQRKYLQLTRGFVGSTQLLLHSDETEQAAAIARRIRDLIANGHRLDDIAILLRVYAQAPAVTAALDAVQIPWTLVNENDGTNSNRSQSRVESDRVTITSMYQAKGLEWAVVFVPGCNLGTIPLARADNKAEERRLFYVALTRARTFLYLHAINEKPLSPYLAEAQIGPVLDATACIQRAIAIDPAQWTPDDFFAVAINAKRLYLHEFFAHWWRVTPRQRRIVAEAVLRFYATLRRKRLLRKFGLGRQDVTLWRQIAGERVNEQPLDRVDINAALSTLE